VGLDFPTARSFRFRLDGSVERQDSLSVHARAVVGDFAPTVQAVDRRLFRLSLAADRPPSLWLFGTELAVQAELRGAWDLRPSDVFGEPSSQRTFRAFAAGQLERPFGANRLVSRTAAGVLARPDFYPAQELIYLGGPVSAPGYDYHSIVGRAAVTEHLEWQFPVPFPGFSLGRFGRVPGSATLAPYAHLAWVDQQRCAATVSSIVPRCVDDRRSNAAYPAVGAGFLTPFDVVRIDVARGLGSRGRWTFGIDLSREFWSIF
jgi:hypothetical protein